ncbi:Innexin [Aphelenchoides fujianensis]|nr:Innexin [Aphelenchoides fujianensis]
MNLLGSAITSIKPRLDDTVVDRLNYYYSTVIIMVMSITLTARQYVGQPLQCWVPAEFSKAWEQYAENYCFVYNTYWVSPEETIPRKVDERVSRQLLYYQWVPFIMALQAGFFYLPVIFWGKTNTGSGINIENIIRMVRDTDKSDKAERAKAVSAICELLEDSLRLQYVRKKHSNRFDHYFKMGLLDGQYVANIYTITKFLYLLNLVGQFLMMNQFLDQNNHLWGADILRDIINGKDWEASGNFPRVALCDFTVRTMANVHRFTIQCVLMLNMFNEKIFLFLYWFFRLDTSERFKFREFCSRVISADGIFVLEMISIQANELYTQEIDIAS